MKKESLEALGAVEVVVSVPIVVHKGIYTLWEKPDGTLRIQYRRDGSDQDDFLELPGPMVKLAKAASEGNMTPTEMMKESVKLMMSMRPK